VLLVAIFMVHSALWIMDNTKFSLFTIPYCHVLLMLKDAANRTCCSRAREEERKALEGKSEGNRTWDTWVVRLVLGMLTAVTWLRAGSSGGHVWTQLWPPVKMGSSLTS